MKFCFLKMALQKSCAKKKWWNSTLLSHNVHLSVFAFHFAGFLPVVGFCAHSVTITFILLFLMITVFFFCYCSFLFHQGAQPPLSVLKTTTFEKIKQAVPRNCLTVKTYSLFPSLITWSIKVFIVVCLYISCIRCLKYRRCVPWSLSGCFLEQARRAMDAMPDMQDDWQLMSH